MLIITQSQENHYKNVENSIEIEDNLVSLQIEIRCEAAK